MSGSVYQHQHRVIYGDCTVGNHVYYSRYLEILEGARGEFFRHVGCALLGMQEAGLGFPVIGLEVTYKGAARYDDLLTIELYLNELRGIRLNIGFRILNAGGTLLAEGETRHVCATIDEKPQRLPKELIEKLQPFLTAQTMSPKYLPILFFMMSTLTQPSKAATKSGPADQCRFIGIRKFNGFTAGSSSNANEQVLLSKVIKAPMAWDELIVSWNADAPAETWLKVEARAIFPGHETKFYTMGVWSRESAQHPRGCVKHQKDDDGTVNEDTLVLNRHGGKLQLRVTLAGPNETLRPKLKFLGLSFYDGNANPAPLPPNRRAWGKIIDTPELSQLSYPQEDGWCSATSTTMVLRRWSGVLHRPDLMPDVPEVAANVYDNVFGGTGNWPFNTAYAGSFPGLRAYVARFSDISELENWITAGIPVIISAPWHLLKPGRGDTGSGHLTVCIGFTKEGDVVINDPATNFKKGQEVRHIYKRADVINAWKESHNTVYLIYPEKAPLPADRFGHWDKP